MRAGIRGEGLPPSITSEGPPRGPLLPNLLAPGEARLRLPLAPNAARHGEDALAAYYQGRVALEDLFPEPGTEGPDVRPGPTRSLKRVWIRRRFSPTRSEPSSKRCRAFARSCSARTALSGRIRVPWALARSILDGVAAGLKSPTAAAFELVGSEFWNERGASKRK
jgi:hypothetical protein